MKQIYKLFWLSLILVASLVVFTGCSQGNTKASKSEVQGATGAETTAGTETTTETGAQASEDSAEITHEPELAPSFELKTLKGETVTLEAYKGQYLFVNFWATWCQYCDEEMPDLMAFQKSHKGEMTVLAINVNEENSVVQKYIDKKKLDLEILLDTDGTVSQLYQVSAFPTTFLIDKAGKIIGYVPGKLTAEDMESAYKYLIEKDTSK